MRANRDFELQRAATRDPTPAASASFTVGGTRRPALLAPTGLHQGVHLWAHWDATPGASQIIRCNKKKLPLSSQSLHNVTLVHCDDFTSCFTPSFCHCSYLVFPSHTHTHNGKQTRLLLLLLPTQLSSCQPIWVGRDITSSTSRTGRGAAENITANRHNLQNQLRRIFSLTPGPPVGRNPKHI